MIHTKVPGWVLKYMCTCRYVPSENDGSRKLADINVAALTNDWLIWDDPGDLQCISEV